jgi:hypothetical protein
MRSRGVAAAHSGSLVRRTRELAFVGAELRSKSGLHACANVTKAILTSV